MGQIETVIFIIFCIILLLFAFYMLSKMPGDMLRGMHESMSEEIKNRDKEYEEKEKLNKGLSKWLFHS